MYIGIQLQAAGEGGTKECLTKYTAIRSIYFLMHMCMRYSYKYPGAGLYMYGTSNTDIAGNLASHIWA